MAQKTELTTEPGLNVAWVAPSNGTLVSPLWPMYHW